MAIIVHKWEDLSQFGIESLTGEACSYGIRLLCDLNEDGVQAISAFFSLATITDRASLFEKNWNSTVNGKPAVASVMLPRSIFTDLSKFLLLYTGHHLVIHHGSGDIIGIMETDEYYGRYLDARDTLFKDSTYTFSPMSAEKNGRNRHQMTGRIT